MVPQEMMQRFTSSTGLTEALKAPRGRLFGCCQTDADRLAADLQVPIHLKERPVAFLLACKPAETKIPRFARQRSPHDLHPISSQSLLVRPKA